MNNDLFAEFSAQFDKPEETLLEQRERIQKEQGITNKPATIKASELTDEEIQKRRLEAGFLSNETEKKFFNQADQVVSVERYGSMPEGLKEAQERNEIRDHGLGLRKGDFVWADKKKKDKVIFKESDTGAFSVLDPNNPNEATKDLLDRKFPGADYTGTESSVQYVCGIDLVSEPRSEKGVTILKSPDGNMVFIRPEEISFEEQLQSILPFFKTDILVEKKEEPQGFEIEMPEVQGEISFTPSTEKAFDGNKIPPAFIDEMGLFPQPKIQTEGVFKIESGKLEAKPVYSPPVEAEAGAKIWIGVDPGKKGAIVAVASNGMVGKWPVPLIQDDVDAVGIWNILNDLKSRYDLTLILEDVHSLFGMSAATNFSMGHTLGILDGIIAASKIRLIRVPPKTWQKEIWEKNDMQYKPLKDEQRKPSVDTKATSMKAARRLFPEADLRATARSRNDSDGICDSACLAEYGRRKNL